jgi:methylthioribose-1-phosphate isomerase
VAAAIRVLAIRGAPLIGVAAGYGLAIELARVPEAETVGQAAELLRAARPTAANLTYAVNRVAAAALAAVPAERAAAALSEAEAIEAEEVTASDAMAAHGADLLGGARVILTHCNTGALAAPGRGTALAVIAELHARGSLDSVLATETRPLLQGARLTAYELARLGVRYELIVDSAAAGLIRRGEPDAVIVGCDRVAANGDVANKVGTYGLALAAHAAGIPFVVAGPTSTIDLECATGEEVVIEDRAPDEVRTAAGAVTALASAPARNPAFDITPAALVTALVTERGVISPVGAEQVEDLFATSRAR